MRIIDKNSDFYDYLQDKSDTIVFDRRGSKILDKRDIGNHFDLINGKEDDKYRFILLQCGATYWLLLATVTDRDLWCANDYKLELLATWKNHFKPRVVIKMDILYFNCNYILNGPNVYVGSYSYDKIKQNVNTLKKMINTNDYKVSYNITDSMSKDYNLATRTRSTKFCPPILKNTGIPSVISAQEIFSALEEHFSLLKTEAERTEAIGVTNDDKITMHGFDVKTSFRG